MKRVSFIVPWSLIFIEQIISKQILLKFLTVFAYYLLAKDKRDYITIKTEEAKQ
jgi:hypothetical protein